MAAREGTGKEWDGRGQGERLERKLKAKPQGEEGQEMVVRGRKERALSHWHAGDGGGQGEQQGGDRQAGMEGKATTAFR